MCEKHKKNLNCDIKEPVKINNKIPLYTPKSEKIKSQKQKQKQKQKHKQKN